MFHSTLQLWRAKGRALQPGKRLECPFQMFPLQGRRDLHPQSGLPFWHDRKTKADDHDTELQGALALGDGLRFVADHDGNDGGGRGMDVEAEPGESLPHDGNIVAQLLYALRLSVDDVDCLAGAAGDGGGDGIGKKARPGSLLQDADDVRSSCDIATGSSAESFAERAREDIHLAETAGMFGSAAAGFSQCANAVGIVDDKQGFIFPAKGKEFWQMGHVSFHAEDTVRHNPAADLLFMLLEP